MFFVAMATQLASVELGGDEKNTTHLLIELPHLLKGDPLLMTGEELKLKLTTLANLIPEGFEG